MLFAHISAYYGNQDVFAQMSKEMPQVFHDDFEAKYAEKLSKWKEGISVVAWDLTEFLLAEVLVGHRDDCAEVKVELVGDNALKRRRDTLTEDRQSRRRIRTEG
jgi:hypothetical protein